jgi:hypothetical protein
MPLAIVPKVVWRPTNNNNMDGPTWLVAHRRDLIFSTAKMPAGNRHCFLYPNNPQCGN